MRLLTNPNIRSHREAATTVTEQVEADHLMFTPEVGMYVTRSGYIARVEGVEVDGFTLTLTLRNLYSRYID